MNNIANTTQTTIEELQKLCMLQQQQIAELTAKLRWFEEQFRLNQHRRFGSIKPFVIERKNWLFSNTPWGATASATIYSIVETAKENGLNPLTYLQYLFEKLPNIDIQDQNAMDDLLPWSSTLPPECRIKP